MEEILHYVWRHRLFEKKLYTDNGQSIEIIDCGLPNKDAGPDFFNAKIIIDGQTWVGNIEIHTESKDWIKHQHHKKKAYNNVILHIVEKANCTINTEDGKTIPQCEIKVPKHIKDNIAYLLYSNLHTPCSNYIRNIPGLHINNWINTLLIERLERKANDIQTLLHRFNNSWNDVFYVLLCRSFGFGLNSDAFERLALSIPYLAIQKQRNCVEEIEALLFGQAGMLNEEIEKDSYYKHLQSLYQLLSKKYQLSPLDSSLFKKLRARPGSHPHIRIAQLAMLLYKEDKLFSKILHSSDIGNIRLLLHENASPYWQTHYCFGEESPKKSKYVGDSSLDILLINAVTPTLFSYGKYIADENLCDLALEYLDKIKAESNSITREFVQSGLLIRNAADSQAVIQLKREYCEKRKCLFCRIGYHVLTNDK